MTRLFTLLFVPRLNVVPYLTVVFETTFVVQLTMIVLVVASVVWTSEIVGALERIVILFEYSVVPSVVPSLGVNANLQFSPIFLS